MNLVTETRRALVLGYGFIGKSLVAELVERGDAVCAFGRRQRPMELPEVAKWYQGDFNNLESLHEALEGTDVVYHLVADSVPKDTHHRLEQELGKLTFSTLDFVQACVERNVSRIVFASSASVYGIQEPHPINERAPTDPISAHGIHKLMIEKYLLMKSKVLPIDVKIARISNPYGRAQDIHGRQGIIAIALGCLLTDKELSLSGDGAAVRDFIAVEDVAAALAHLGTTTSVQSVFNVSSGYPVRLSTMLDLLAKLSHRQLRIKYGPSISSDIPYSCLSFEALLEAGWSPKVSFGEGIKDLVSWHLQAGEGKR